MSGQDGVNGSLPSILAVLGVEDHGPSDGAGSACCPHCGASGRYIVRFLCADGTRRGAMRGCFKLYPGASSMESRLVQEAYDRAAQAKIDGRSLASWWSAIISAAERVTPQTISEFRLEVQRAESERQGWLRRKGFGRYGRRGK